MTFLQAIKSIAAAIAAIVGLFRDGVAAWSAQQERDAGKAEANASTLQQNADRVNEAQAAAAEADADHAKNPAGDAGLDTDFRRSE